MPLSRARASNPVTSVSFRVSPARSAATLRIVILARIAETSLVRVTPGSHQKGIDCVSRRMEGNALSHDLQEIRNVLEQFIRPRKRPNVKFLNCGSQVRVLPGTP